MPLTEKISGTTTDSTTLFNNGDDSNAVSTSTLKNQSALVYVNNGYATDATLNKNSIRAVANKTLTAKFNEVDQRIENIEKTGVSDKQFEELANKLAVNDTILQTEVEKRKAADEQIIQDATDSFNAVKDEIEVLDNELQTEIEERKAADEQTVTNIAQIIENIESINSLYKSDTNASKWECGEGYFTGYLGGQSETAIKAKVGFNIENNVSYLPSYPTVVGTYYALNNQDNALTGKLNLTPINSTASPLFSFTGSGAVSMGQRNIYLDSDWFNQSTDNINLCLPATSGTLITENNAMGSLDFLVDDLDVTEINITEEQYNYLCRYPKAEFALVQKRDEYGNTNIFRYFIKIGEASIYTKFLTYKSDCIGIATVQQTSEGCIIKIDYKPNNEQIVESVNSYINETDDHLSTLDDTTSSLQEALTTLSNKETGDAISIQASIAKETEERKAADEKIAALESRCETLEKQIETLQELVNNLTNDTNTLNYNS